MSPQCHVAALSMGVVCCAAWRCLINGHAFCRYTSTPPPLPQLAQQHQHQRQQYSVLGNRCTSMPAPQAMSMHDPLAPGAVLLPAIWAWDQGLAANGVADVQDAALPAYLSQLPSLSDVR